MFRRQPTAEKIDGSTVLINETNSNHEIGSTDGSQCLFTSTQESDLVYVGDGDNQLCSTQRPRSQTLPSFKLSAAGDMFSQ